MNPPSGGQNGANFDATRTVSSEAKWDFAEGTLAEIAPLQTRRVRRSRSNLPAAALPDEVAAGPGLGLVRSGKGSSYREPATVGDVLLQMLKKMQWENKINATSLISAWPQIVGENVAKHTKPRIVGDDQLEIITDSTPWAQQLKILLPQIEKTISQIAGEGTIKKIIIRGPKPPSWQHGKYSVRGRGPRDTYG